MDDQEGMRRNSEARQVTEIVLSMGEVLQEHFESREKFL